MRCPTSLLPAFLLAIAACSPPPASQPSAPSAVGFSLSPRVAGRGTSVEVTLTSRTSLSSPPSLDLGDDVTVEDVSLVDDTHAVARVDVAGGAELGWRDAAVSAGGREVSLGSAFDVVAESISVAPSAVSSGTVAIVTITGTSTSFADGETWPSFGDGVDVLDVLVNSPTSLTARIGVHADAHGVRDVAVTTRDEGVTEYGALDVAPGTTATFSPSSLPMGAISDLSITGIDASAGVEALEFYDHGGPARDVVLTDVVGRQDGVYGHAYVVGTANPGSHDVLVRLRDGSAYYLGDAFLIAATPPDVAGVVAYAELSVVRTVDSATCEVTDTVVARASFFPDDLPCGSSSPPSSGPMPYDEAGVFPAPPAAAAEDCPPERTVGAGDRVWLESTDDAIALYAVPEAGTGRIVYESRALTADDYRFGEVYSLRTEGQADGLPAMTLPRVLRTAPGEADPLAPDLCGATWSRGEDQTLEWTPTGTYPDGFVVATLSGTLVQTGDDGFVGVIPWDDGAATVPAWTLSELEPGEATASLKTLADDRMWTDTTVGDTEVFTESSSSFETRWTISLE